MTDAERYAKRRIAALTRDIAACIFDDTLGDIIMNIEDDPPHPMPQDLMDFMAELKRHRAVADGLDQGVPLHRIEDRLDRIENDARR